LERIDEHFFLRLLRAIAGRRHACCTNAVFVASGTHRKGQYAAQTAHRAAPAGAQQELGGTADIVAVGTIGAAHPIGLDGVGITSARTSRPFILRAILSAFTGHARRAPFNPWHGVAPAAYGTFHQECFLRAANAPYQTHHRL